MLHFFAFRSVVPVFVRSTSTLKKRRSSEKISETESHRVAPSTTCNLYFMDIKFFWMKFGKIQKIICTSKKI